jgi:hypothetical protein
VINETASDDAYGNEEVRNALLVLGPCLAILVPAALDITQGTVGDHAREEEWVEPREGAVEASDETPVQGEVEVAGVMDLASFAVCAMLVSFAFTAGVCKTYTTRRPESWSHRRR